MNDRRASSSSTTSRRSCARCGSSCATRASRCCRPRPSRRRSTRPRCARRRRRSSTSCCPTATASRSPQRCASGRRCRSSCSQRGRRGGREGPRAGGGRRRLRDQAVRAARAGGAPAGRAAARRPGRVGAGAARPTGCELDLAAHTVRVDGAEVHLTPIEFNLLRVLAVNRGRLMTHRALLIEVWGPEYADDVQVLRVHIANLRRKIGAPALSSTPTRASATASRPEASSASRTSGATSVPSSSIARITSACGSVPTLICSRKRSWLKISCWKRIFSTISVGLPTKFAPRSSREARYCSRVSGGQPRSRPIRSIIALNAGNDVVDRVLRALGDEAVRVDRERLRRVAALGERAAVQLGQRREALRVAADDRQRHRQAEQAGARGATAGCRRPRPRPAAGPAPGAGRRRAVDRRAMRPDHVTCSTRAASSSSSFSANSAS